MIHSVSRKSNILLSILFLLLLTDTVLVTIHLVRSHQDTLIINKLGQIRGSIQQYSKRELNSVESDYIEKRIRGLFSETKELLKEKHFFSNAGSAIDELNLLQERYIALEELVHAYRTNPEASLSKGIFKTSEELWSLSNSTVLEAQVFFERMQRTLYYYHIPGVTFILFLVAFLLVRIKRVIRDGLEYEAHIDTLTGALNKATFHKELEQKIEEAKRFERQLTVLYLDIDHFKRINDTYGHKTGDEILSELGGLLRENIRITDSFGRIGGEEFVIAAQETDLENAYQLAEKLRSEVQKKRFVSNLHITISIGLGEFQDDTADLLLQKADRALYRAKERGRNRTET